MRELRVAGLQYQYGFSKFGLLSTLIVLIGMLTFLLKVLPVYIDHNFVRGVAETLMESGRGATLTQAEVREEVADRLRINNVREFDLNSITMARESGAAVINIRYEKRIPLISNIDLLISFDERIQ
jgi:hypothetical protein